MVPVRGLALLQRLPVELPSPGTPAWTRCGSTPLPAAGELPACLHRPGHRRGRLPPHAGQGRSDVRSGRLRHRPGRIADGVGAMSRAPTSGGRRGRPRTGTPTMAGLMVTWLSATWLNTTWLSATWLNVTRLKVAGLAASALAIGGFALTAATLDDLVPPPGSLQSITAAASVPRILDRHGTPLNVTLENDWNVHGHRAAARDSRVPETRLHSRRRQAVPPSRRTRLDRPGRGTANQSRQRPNRARRQHDQRTGRAGAASAPAHGLGPLARRVRSRPAAGGLHQGRDSRVLSEPGPPMRPTAGV